MTEIKEIGGRAIYEMRARKQPWEHCAAETRASYRARMQELLNALGVEGYEIVRKA